MMQQQADSRTRWTRRSFVALAVGGLASTMFGGRAASAAPRRRRSAVRTFDVVHDRSVVVWMSNGRRFEVCVKEATTGVVIERHERVTAKNLLDIRSDHFQIVECA